MWEHALENSVKTVCVARRASGGCGDDGRQLMDASARDKTTSKKLLGTLSTPVTGEAAGPPGVALSAGTCLCVIALALRHLSPTACAGGTRSVPTPTPSGLLRLPCSATETTSQRDNVN